MTYQPDHIATAEGELLSQHRKPQMLGFIRGVGRSIQRLEDDVLLLRTDRLLDNAEGVQLDRYGEIVGEARLGLVDDDYRAIIRSRIAVNISQGKTDELIDIFRRLTGVEPELFEHFPMSYRLVATVAQPLTANRRARIDRMMDLARPAGYSHTLTEATPTAFRLDAGPGLDSGELAEVIR